MSKWLGQAGIAKYASVRILHHSKFDIRISSPPSWGLPDTTCSVGGVFIMRTPYSGEMITGGK
jgi:hypothetical protein